MVIASKEENIKKEKGRERRIDVSLLA